MMIYSILGQLEATSSRNEKLAILESQKQNMLLQRVIHESLNPFRNFYIKQIPAYDPAGTQPLDWAIDQLDQFANRRVTGNAASYLLANILSALTREDADVFCRIIKKDLRCGVSDATVNKVWDNIIPSYPCMLCSPYEDKLMERMTFPAFAQLKMDGMRFAAIVFNNVVEYRSRNGKELNLMGQLDSEFLNMAAGRNVVFDGELLIVDEGQILSRQTGNGILSKANKGTITQAEAEKVHATVWDCIDYSDFVAGYSAVPYKMRFQNLTSVVKSDKIHLVKHAVVANKEQAQQLFEEYLAEGQEGIILKDPNGVWEDKRAKHQVKFKGELECDLRIVGWEDGTGKNAGRLGALVLQSEDGLLKTNVGTGFTDEARDTITRDVIGKIASIKYNARIRDKKTGIESLFLPVFICVRFDKDIADTITQIQ